MSWLVLHQSCLHGGERYISHIGPLDCFVQYMLATFFAVYEVSLGKANEGTDSSGKKANAKSTAPAKMALERLCDYTVLLTATAMLPMFKHLQAFILVLQKEQLYICDASDSVKSTLTNINGIYGDITAFSGEEFRDCMVLRSPESKECPLAESASGKVVLQVKWSEKAVACREEFELTGRKGGKGRPGFFAMEELPVVVQYVKDAVKKIATALTDDISRRFPEPDVVKSLGLVFPQTVGKLSLCIGHSSEEFNTMFSDFCAWFVVERGGEAPLINAS